MASIAVLGLGYVGLTTGLGLKYLGHSVIGFDIDLDKVKKLRAGHLTIFEKNLQEILETGLSDETVSFTDELDYAVRSSEFVFVCVPTPQDVDGAADLSFVLASIESIRSSLQPGSVVVLKSTVPAGSAARVTKVLDRDDVSIVSNPEFLREGSALADFLNPDRIVIGADVPEAAERVAHQF